MKKLFTTPMELITGYGLPTPEKRGRKKGVSETDKVRLRARVLPSGNVQMYLYSNASGRVVRHSIGSLRPERTPEDKSANTDAVRLAKAKAGLMNADAVRVGHGFSPSIKNKVSFLSFVRKLSDVSGQKDKHDFSVLSYRVKDYWGSDISVSEIDKGFVLGFIAYLLSTSTMPGYTAKPHKLSDSTIHWIYRKFVAVMNRARKMRLTTFNVGEELDASETPPKKQAERAFLNADEVQRLADTPCINPHVKSAFIFCCFTGLRFGDVKKLTWSDIHDDGNGKCVRITMSKTKDLVTSFIPNVCAGLVERPSDAKDTDRVFNLLPNNTNSNRDLTEWAKAAGVKKRVTFHVSRHTAATLLLNLGTPIEVVAKQLGHKKLSTTQIYAKILGKTQADAVAKFDGLGLNII